MSTAWLRAAAQWTRTFVAPALLFFTAAITAAHADAPAPVSFPSTGGYSAKLQGSRSNVAIVELSGDYSRDLANGQLNVEPRTQVSKEFYKHFSDRYDFIVVFSNFEFTTGDARAFYIGVKNDTKGLGRPLYDNTSYFGSQGSLQGYIDMAALSRYHLDPSDPRFEEAMLVLSHEMLHRWAAKVHFLDSAGQANGALLGRDGAHWSFLLDTGGSVEYGNRWSDNGDGTFTTKPDRQFFSPLDLYLMGMLKKEEVPWFFYIDSAGVDATRIPEAGVTIQGARHDVTIDQIIAAEGARDPNADNAQKQFRLGFVLLTRPGIAPSDVQIQNVDAVRQAFETRLTALTAGKALVHAFLEPKPLEHPNDPSLPGAVVGTAGSTANVIAALGWLRGKQQVAGEWYDNQLTRLRDTVVAASALADVGPGDRAIVDKAMAWLTTQSVANTDYVARRIQALATKATEADWAQLASTQNADGGWGVAPGYQSTPLDSALAVTALALDPNPTRQALARDRAKAFLLSKQNVDGGWSHAVNGVSRTATTAQVIRALATLDAVPQVATAARFLAGRQNSDGGFGDSPSTTHDTSNVMLALAATGQLGAVRALDGFNFLNATQQPDGSWDGSVYATGLAIRTLGAAQTYNWAASSLTATPGAVRDGQRVALSLAVNNTGTVAAPASTVKVFDGDPVAGVVLAEMPVPPLPPGGTAVVHGSWSTLNQPGNHLLSAVVDPASLGSEMTRNDNTAVVRVAVASAPVQPDLTVTATDVQVMPAVINRLPTNVSVVAQLANIGQTDAIGVKVRLLMGPTADTMVVVDEKLVNLLGRSTIAVTTSFQVTRPGRQLLAVVVDADATVADIDRSNNRADVQIDTVSSFDPAVFANELVVPTGQVMLGADVTLKATLHNQGTADTPPFQAVLTVSDGTTVREIGRIAVQIPAGGQQSFALPWRVDLTGQLEFKVVLDPAAAVSDLDRSNNEARAAFTAALPPAGPNLTVSFRDFLIDPDPANEGHSLALKATIRNIGNQPATNVEFGFYEGDPAAGGVLLAPIQAVPTIAAGATIEVSAQLTNVVGSAERLYFVAVDPAAKITETSKEDNTAFRVVDVRALPDLAVSAGNINLSPSAPKPGDTLTVAVDVQNLGQQTAAPVLVRLLDGDTVLGEQTIASIAAQSKHTATFSLTLPPKVAARTLTVVVDPANAVQETNKANNTATRSLTVQNGTAFVSEPYFSPNGDGIKDTVSFGFRLDTAAVTRVLVVDENDLVVRTFTGLGSGPQTEGSVLWDGRDDYQRIANDGTYRFRAVGADGQQLAQASAVLDTNRTPILRASGTPSEYYRNLTCRVPSFQDWATTLDEQSLFVTSMAANQSGIYRVALQGGEVSTVVPATFVAAGGNSLQYLSASMRGERVVFGRWNYHKSSSGEYIQPHEIWTVGGDGAGLRLLATSDAMVASDAYSSANNILMTHDGSAVIAQLNLADGSSSIRRYPVDPAAGPMRVLYDSREHGNVGGLNLDVAPNRRRALMRVWNSSTGKNELAVLDFETGLLMPAPADLYPGSAFPSVKWSPDSNHFVLFDSVERTGVEAGNITDFEFDVFDADFNLTKRFRTEKGAGDGNSGWYGSSVSGPEWSSAGDEFVFSLDPRPNAWYGGAVAATDWSPGSPALDGPKDKTFYRAHIGKGTLSAVSVDPQMLDRQRSLWWAPNDRTALAQWSGRLPSGNYGSGYNSTQVDNGQSSDLFPKWGLPELNPNAQTMSVSNFAASGRRLFFTSYRDSSNIQSSCYAPSGGAQLFAYESLQNLVADLQPLRDPRVGGVLLRGTAADINFASYQLDYANTKTPTEWHTVAVPGTEEKFGANLATWVPPSYGTFFVRLTVQDRAGNTAAAVRRVTWSDTPSITDLVKDFDYISPNGDGVQDKVKLSYRVLEPVHLAFEVKREDGTRVRLIERDHASIGSDFAFEWDGRDDEGRVAPDGKYSLRVLDYEFPVEVDTVFPELRLSTSDHAFNYVADSASFVTFQGAALREAVTSLDFVMAPDRSYTASIEDALSKTWRTYSFGPGANTLAWDGLDDQSRELPAGTYVVSFAVSDGTPLNQFMAELSRDAGAVHVVYRPVMAAVIGKVLTPPFSMVATDRLLTYGTVQLELGRGDPPAVWQFGFKDLQVQPLPVGVQLDPPYLAEDKYGLPTAQLSGSNTWLTFSGSRLRATAQDKAGNLVSAVSPYRTVRELVLLKGSADYWAPGDPVKVEKIGIRGITNFSDTALKVSALSVAPPPPGYELGALALSFADNLTSPAVKVELRHAFLPTPKPKPGESRPPVSVPNRDDMRLLQWTTVPLRGLSPTEVSKGITELDDSDNVVQFRWQLPNAGDGVWLYQIVERDQYGEELKSHVYWTVATTISPALPQFSWLAWHEPAQSCGADVSEIAHVTMHVSRYSGFDSPMVRGERLYKVLADGSRELMFEAALNNLSSGFEFHELFSTAGWSLGRHDFEVEFLDIENRWEKVASPYIYVNHTAPQVKIGSPVDGQKMCATHIAVPNVGTIGYLPMSVEVKEPYAAYQDLQLQKPDESWVPRGPVGAPATALSVPATTASDDYRVCLLQEGCGDTGPIVWPTRPGNFVHANSGRLYGLGLGTRDHFELDPLVGKVTARLRVFGPSGHLACTPVTVDVDGRVEGVSSIDRGLFSPNGDGVADDVSVTVTALEALTVKVEVFRAVRDQSGNVTPLDEPAVATLARNLALSDGDRPFTWDGRNIGGQVVADGLYAFRVTLTDGCGNEKIDVWPVEVDNTPPTIVIDSPKPNAAVPIEFFIKGSASDLHPLRYEVAAVSDRNPDAPMNLPNLGGMNNFHINLAAWNTAGLTGGAKIVVRAFDTVGNSSLLELPIQLTEPADIIAAFNASPDPFSPNGDGRREKVSLLYSLSRAANLTLDLMRTSTGAKIKTLVKNVPAVAGNGSIVWDGRNDSSVVEPDEDVAAVLTAEIVTNGDVSARQVARTGFTLDKTPPVIAFTLPKGPVTAGRGGVVARATDPLFSDANLSVSVNGAPYLSLVDATDDTGTLTAPLDDIPEGPITLRVKAADRAENQSTSTLNVILDRTPPKPAITAPLPNAYISGRKQPYAIEGGIEELHLASYQLTLAGNILLQGTTLPPTAKLLTWDPLTVADGPYTLTLKADDRAELTGSASVPITIDNTPPVATIKSTGTPMYLRIGTVLKGTATDLNFVNYRVELAPGGSTSTRWTEVARGTSEINDAALTTLSVLPPDGVYGVRLTVLDKAGNESFAVQDVTVDTLAPQSVTLSADLQNRHNANVKWNAAVEADVAGYILFRNGSRVNTALLTATTYLDAGLAPGTYAYTVKAVDRAGNESEPSNEGRVVVSSSQPVAQIFAPTRDAWAAGLMDVRGTAMSPADFKEYRLYIGAGTAPAAWQLLRRSPLAITADTLSAWNTLSLIEGAQYTLKLEAEDLSGVVATDSVTVKVKNTPPKAPILLQGTLSVNNIALTWTANTEPDLQGYLLYRNQQLANATGLVIGSMVPYLIKPAAYNDLAVPDGKHRYFLQAMDQAGNVSDPSNEVEFTVDTHPPHVPITKPTDGNKVSQTTTLIGESRDTDIARVQFQYKPVASSTWVDIGVPLTNNAGPWTIEWSTASLPYGSYNVRAVATDEGGKVDPAPGFITLVLTDLRKPDPATNLTTRVTGGDVALNWMASGSSYAVGYHIDRVEPTGTVTRLTTTPLAALTYTDAGRPDAGYVYRVTAVSAGGTESGASNDAAAVVFTPTFVQPYTPTPDVTTLLLGEARATHHVVLRKQGGADITEAASDETGSYHFDVVPLALGDNRFEVIAHDDLGNTSNPAPWHAFRGQAPAAPTGLDASAAGHDVTLNWASNLEGDLEGYVPALAGVLRNSVITPSSIAASSTYPYSSYYSADRAIDTELSTGWSPSYLEPIAGQWLELNLDTRRIIDGMSLLWGNGQIPNRYRIEGYDGEVWVPLAQLQNTTGQPNIDIKFARAYRTSRLRVLIAENSNTNVQLNDVRLSGPAVTSTRSATFASLPDGYASVGVIAVSQLGFASPLSEAKPAVGDVTPPDAPVLQAQAALSGAQLSWVGPSNVDVAGFQIQRDGVLIATLTNGATHSYSDPALPNAHYGYVVSAVDSVGNVSLPSNRAAVDIAVAGPNAPIAATATAPAGGGVAIVTWTVGTGPQPGAFVLQRATRPSGPYIVLASGVPASPYADHDVHNGIRYYYVVLGVDGLGNVGSTSNEVNAQPDDRLAPTTPYFVLPSRSPGPVFTPDAQTTLVGFAEPGSQVVITKGDGKIGMVDTTAEVQQQTLYTNGNSVFDVARDGSLVYFNSNGTAVHKSDGTPVASASLLANSNIEGFRFAPDGRSAAVVSYDGRSGHSVLSRWDRTTDKRTVLSLPVWARADLLAFSPDGSQLLTNAYDATLGQPGLVIVQWASGASRFVAGDILGAAWSPDGQTIAITSADGLRLIDPLLTRDVTVAGVTDPRSPSWLPDGSGLLVEQAGSLGRRAIARVTLPDFTVVALADATGVDYTGPVVSPEGDAYLANRDGSLVLRGFTGSEEVLSGQSYVGYGAPIWSSSKTIGFLRNYGQLVLHTPAGQFLLPDTALNVGSNMFGAYAVDAAGNTSAPALPLEVRRSSDTLPDWSVTNDSWFVFPASPRVGEATDIAITVKNLGVAASATPVSVIAVDEQGLVTTLFSGSLQALAKDAQQTLRMPWTGGQPGRYTLMAVVDPGNLTDEVTKDNNQAARQVFVTASTGHPELQVRTDKLRYAGGETVKADITAVNAGAQFDGSVIVHVVDTGGAELLRFDASPVQNLVFGQPQTLAYTWPSGTTFAGDYRVTAELLGADGQLVTSAAADFAIDAGATLGSAVVTDRSEYLTGDNVNVQGTVRYLSGNVPALDTTPAVLAVLSGSGDTLATRSIDLQGMLQGSEVQVDLSWPAAQPGSYTARLTVGPAGTPSTVAQSAFAVVVPTAPQVVGHLQVAGDVFTTTEAIPTTSSLTNLGAAINPLVVRVRALDTTNGQTLASWSGELAGVRANAVTQAAVLSGTWPLGSFELRLEAQVGGNWLLLDRARVQAAERTPPGVAFTGPAAGAVVRSTATVTALATARQAPVAKVELLRGAETWFAMLPQNASAGLYFSNALPTADGPVTLQARASDTLSNTSSVVTLSIVIDNTPPLITVTGVADQQVSRASVAPVIAVADANPLSQAIVLDGVPFVSGAPVGEGAHVLTIDAVDKADNRSTKTVAFTVDLTPPVVTLVAPAPRLIAKAMPLVQATATDALTGVSAVQLRGVDGSWTSVPANTGGYGVTPPAAIDGDYTLALRATDVAGNTSAPLEFALTIDATPPLITVTGVVQGGTTVGSATPVISVTDKHLATTDILLDGVPFVSGTAVTANGSHTLSVKASDRAGNESQQTVVFQVDAAVSLGGSLGISPNTVAIGDTVVLDARVTNASASALSGVQVSLVIRDHASGAVLQTFNDVAALAQGGAYQHAWSWAASGTAGALLDAALTATANATVMPIAQGTIQLSAPNTAIGLQTTLASTKKLLVYVRCTRQEDDTWDNCLAPNRTFSNPTTVSACTSDRVTWLDQYLTARGVAHTVVSDEANFLRELRSGRYSTYWIGGGALKLGSLAAAEVQAAVRRGDTLLTEGWTAGRNPVLDTVSSVSFLGKWSSLQTQIYTIGSVLPSATLVVNTPVRFNSSTGTNHATMNNGLGIVSGTYGRGRTMAFAFDLSGTLRAANDATLATWNGLGLATLQYLDPTAPSEVAGGGVFELKAAVNNAGTLAQLLDYAAKVPAQAQVLQTVPQATASTVEGGLPTLRWRATAAPSGALAFDATLRAPVQEGDYVVSSIVNQINASGSSTLLQNQQLALHVFGPVSLANAAFDKVQALALTGSEASAKAVTLTWLSLAKMSIADGRWDDALRQLIAAQSAWQPVQGTQAEDDKLAIARVIEAVERRL